MRYSPERRRTSNCGLMMSWSCPPAVAKFSQPLFSPTPSPMSWALPSIISEVNMENQPLLDDPRKDPLSRNGARTSLLPPRRQYMEMPFPEVFEEPGPGALPEYLQILRRRRGALILIVFLGLLASLLFTLPQRSDEH